MCIRTHELCDAIQSNDAELVQKLMNEETPVDDGSGDYTLNPLYHAVFCQDTRLAQMLLDRGANPNIWVHGLYSKDDLDVTRSTRLFNAKYMSLLHLACRALDHDLIEILIKGGADVNMCAHQLGSPLRYVLRNRNNLIRMNGPERDESVSKIIKLLVENGANLNYVHTGLNVTIIHSLVSSIYYSELSGFDCYTLIDTEMIQFLLDNDADPSIPDLHGASLETITRALMKRAQTSIPSRPFRVEECQKILNMLHQHQHQHTARHSS